ncbi:MAG: hypothetical protein EOL87_13390 [Spartobacteria bacterium]|nr:hypothetical protein [Spartobacteria bacterium]
MKGTALNIGADELVDILRRIEASCRCGNLEELNAAGNMLEEAISRLRLIHLDAFLMK